MNMGKFELTGWMKGAMIGMISSSVVSWIIFNVGGLFAFGTLIQTCSLNLNSTWWLVPIICGGTIGAILGWLLERVD